MISSSTSKQRMLGWLPNQYEINLRKSSIVNIVLGWSGFDYFNLGTWVFCSRVFDLLWPGYISSNLPLLYRVWAFWWSNYQLDSHYFSLVGTWVEFILNLEYLACSLSDNMEVDELYLDLLALRELYILLLKICLRDTNSELVSFRKLLFSFSV